MNNDACGGGEDAFSWKVTHQEIKSDTKESKQRDQIAFVMSGENPPSQEEFCKLKTSQKELN